jgi:glutathione synthase/RimK-type ligase-like ATP-grasp enzyme
MTGVVLLWGLLEDPTFRAVHDALQALGAQVALVDHAALDRTRVRLSDRDEREHTLSFDGQALPLSEIEAAYLRPYDLRHYELAPPGNRRAALVHHLMADWAEQSAGTIVNRPSAEATNHSKLVQAPHARACGFATPASIVTNDREELLAFHASHGKVVIKSLSSVRSVVRELSPARLVGGKGGIGPVFAQRRIDGRTLRVHVVGERTFACEIASAGVDYRYAPSAMAPTALAEDLARRCVALTRRLGLLIAGIDLIVTPAGECYFLEANPNPGFSAFDPGQARSIAVALARLLAGQAHPQGHRL